MNYDEIGMGETAEQYDNIDAMAEMVPVDPEADVRQYGPPEGGRGMGRGCVNMNIPVLIRVLEMVREETPEGPEGDTVLHSVVEAIAEVCGQYGMVTMDNYDMIEAAKEAACQTGCEPMSDEEAESAVEETNGYDAEEMVDEADAEDADADEADVEDADADEDTDEADAEDADANEDADEDANEDDAEDADTDEDANEDADEDDAEDEEGSSPFPFESMSRVKDPVMESFNSKLTSYLGNKCVVAEKNWDDAKKTLSDGWDKGFKTLVVDESVMLLDDIAMPNYDEDGFVISRPFNKDTMLKEAYRLWYKSANKIVETKDEE